MSEHRCVNIILIETSTSLCSVALCRDGEIISYRESPTPKSQASLTAPFIQEVLEECHLKVTDCDGVCVSSGPGSYTGLRVGVSTAKGLCFGANLPLYAISTMDILVEMGRDRKCDYTVPMIDARRMEVYAAVFNRDGQQISKTEPVVVDENSFSEYLQKGTVLFIGDGAEKCRGTLTSANAEFLQCYPTAKAMGRLAYRLFHEGKKENVAYFEPFYLKDFIATISKKSLF
jgi:tRNA threonylcarbamoyladenosine biosynthesis protein TsaB